MGKSHNDTIVLVIAFVCKIIIIVGCIIGFVTGIAPKGDTDYNTFHAWVFAAVFACSIFVWIARDPTLE